MVFYRTFASHDYLFFVAALEDLVSIIFPTTCSNKKAHLPQTLGVKILGVAGSDSTNIP
ncbi:hypothetical protein CIPAW_13G145400 [Carya illinoinensis]|uniref:Uncharacterized protein n=1 Tax=Carya illinoinensis TaxID=32201 RepID=A0A8T1NTM7_CARIL|nr:hypothetical protein CIPAW_13G145400 [Carya illinoinensis]